MFFNFAIVGQKQIDAIGISDSALPIEAKINSTDFYESLLNPEVLPLGDLIPANPVISFDGQKLFFSEETLDKERIFFLL